MQRAGFRQASGSSSGGGAYHSSGPYYSHWSSSIHLSSNRSRFGASNRAPLHAVVTEVVAPKRNFRSPERSRSRLLWQGVE